MIDNMNVATIIWLGGLCWISIVNILHICVWFYMVESKTITALAQYDSRPEQTGNIAKARRKLRRRR